MPQTVSIQTVAELTGLTPHAIRAWEKRYGAIEPARSKGRHRLYAQQDVQRLKLLAAATQSGRSIGRVVQLDNVQLQELLAHSASGAFWPSGQITLGAQPSQENSFIERALGAIASLDTRAMEEAYQSAQISLGDQGLLRRVIVPLAWTVGERWRSGLFTASQEHFFTAISKVFLWNLTRQYHLDACAPKIVVGTPAGQIHDLGASIVAAAAANNGWNVCYVGANLPAFELAGAVQTTQSSALALSIVYPEDDPKLDLELAQLHRILPSEVRLLVGGRATHAYAASLSKYGARIVNSLEDFDAELDALRKTTSG